MELIKNLLKYFLILLVIVVLVGAFIAGILFFFPSTELFGFKFVQNHESSTVGVTNANIAKINVETNNYNIVVVPNSVTGIENNANLRIDIINNYTGFANKFNTGTVLKNVNADSETFESVNDFKLSSIKKDDEYTIILHEPTGIVSYGDSRIVLYVPEALQGVEYNLTTNTGKISFEKNSVNASRTIPTGDINLSVSSARGSFNLNNVNMKDGSDLTIKNYIGRVEINSEKIGNVNIDSNSGNFTFNSIGYEGFTGGNLTVKGNNPYITIKNKIFGTLNIETTTGFLKADELVGDGIISTENGIIRIKRALAGIELSNNSGETTIDCLGKTDSPAASVNIKSKSGTIKLGTGALITESDEFTAAIYALNNVTTETGRVIIENLYKSDAEIETTKGSVKVDFANNNTTKNLTVTTTSGAVELNNIYGNMVVTTGNSAKIKASFVAIASQSSFKTDGGEVELILPAPTNEANKKYNLNLINKTNRLSIDIGSFKVSSFENKDDSGLYKFSKTFPESETTTNEIKVETNSGKINIHEN